MALRADSSTLDSSVGLFQSKADTGVARVPLLCTQDQARPQPEYAGPVKRPTNKTKLIAPIAAAMAMCGAVAFYAAGEV